MQEKNNYWRRWSREYRVYSTFSFFANPNDHSRTVLFTEWMAVEQVVKEFLTCALQPMHLEKKNILETLFLEKSQKYHYVHS